MMKVGDFYGLMEDTYLREEGNLDLDRLLFLGTEDCLPLTNRPSAQYGRQELHRYLLTVSSEPTQFLVWRILIPSICGQIDTFIMINNADSYIFQFQ
jgi:hypothetical protein